MFVERLKTESVPPVPNFEELGLDPAAAIPHSLLHLRLHCEHLVLGNALLAPHLGIRLQPRPGASHLRALGTPAVGEIGVAATPVHVVTTLHLHCHNTTPDLETTPNQSQLN